MKFNFYYSSGMRKIGASLDHTVAIRYTMSVETLDIGEDTGTPVNLSYDVPFKFTGGIQSVTIELKQHDPSTASMQKDVDRKAAEAALSRE
jgi:hypothetical protein